ncbi:hypothetical protein P7K49_002419, partial [Saguinus oedipus]
MWKKQKTKRRAQTPEPPSPPPTVAPPSPPGHAGRPQGWPVLVVPPGGVPGCPEATAQQDQDRLERPWDSAVGVPGGSGAGRTRNVPAGAVSLQRSPLLAARQTSPIPPATGTFRAGLPG